MAPNSPFRKGGSIRLLLKKGTEKIKRRKGDADSLKAPTSPKTVCSADCASLCATADDCSRPPSRAKADSAPAPADPLLTAAQKQLVAASDELDKAVAIYVESLTQEKQKTQAALLDACFVAEAVGTPAPAFAASLADDKGADALVVFVDSVVASRAERTPSKSEHVYGFADKYSPFLKLVLGAASDVADMAPVGVPVAVKGVVGVFGILLDAVSSDLKRSAEIPELLGDVVFGTRRVQDSRTARADTAATISSLLLVQEMELLTASTVFLRHVLERWIHGPTHNLVRSAFSSNYDDAKRGLARAVDRFNQALDSQLQRTALQSHKLLVQLTTTAVSDWLQAAYESVSGEFEKNRDAREEGTFLWVLALADYCAWRDGPVGEPGLFWLNALPGTGKSTIAALVVQTLIVTQPDAAVAYFFCDSTHATLHSLPVLIRTIAAQLAAQLPHMQTHLARLQEDKTFQPCDPRAEDDSNRAKRLFKTLIRDGLRTDDADAPTKDVFVVLDGLDELDQRQDLTWLLPALRALPVKVFVSSRRDWAILQALQDTERQHFVTADEVCTDIRTHIGRVLGKTPILKKAFQHPQITPLAPDPVALLTDKADGNFQYAHLALDDLTRASEGNVEAFKAALVSLPADLQAMYGRIMVRLENEGFLDTARAIFCCLIYAYARTPLTVAELEDLVTRYLGREPHTDPFFDFARTVEKHCGVVLQRVGGGFAIAHETFKAYMIDPRAASGTFMPEPGTANPYTLFYLPSHVQLSVACMQTLSWNPDPEEASVAAAAWKYAAWGWCFHMGALSELRFMEDDEPSHLTGADMLRLLRRLRSFLQSPGMQHWVVSELTRTTTHFITNYAPGLPENLLLAWTTIRDADTPADANTDDDADDDDATTLADWLTGEFPQALQAPFCRAWLHTNWKDTEAFEDANKLVHRLMSGGNGDGDGFYSPDTATQWANLASWAPLGGWTPEARGLPAGNYAALALSIAIKCLANGTSIDTSHEQALRDNEYRLRLALEDVPACTYWRIILLAYLAARNRIEEALAEREQLVAHASSPLAPVCINARMTIGRALMRNERAAEAEAVFRLALADIDEAAQAGVSHPDAKLFWHFLSRLGGPEHEIAVLQEALEKDPKGHALYTSRLSAAEKRAKRLAEQAEKKQAEDKPTKAKQAGQTKPPKVRIQKKTMPFFFSLLQHTLVFLVFGALFGGALLMCFESSRGIMNS